MLVDGMTASSSAIITLRVQLTLPTVTAANRPTIVVKIQLFRDMQWLMIQSRDSSILRAKQSIRFDDSITGQLEPVDPPPFPQIDIIGAMVIVWRVRGKIIRSVLCNIVCNCAQCHAHSSEQT